MVASSWPASFSAPTVLTIVASTSAVAATVVMLATEFSSAVLTWPNASSAISPSMPSEPSAAAVVFTSPRRVEAGSPEFCSSIVS